ncbi:ABC transporter permease subunit [Mesorhizobium argentiipisi]|uniref:Xylose transport system permease protein XylH n=1 Tax=Mesorhizobium argentiipisi TaxID=3015175 RepID=A0ABU8KCJ0_9HYPH
MNAKAAASAVSTQNVAATAAPSRQSLEAERSNWRIIILILATVAIWIGFHIWTGVFISPRNLSNLAVQAAITAVIAAGLCWLLVAREIDLSVGSLLAMCGVLCMLLMQKAGLGAYPTILIVLLVGVGVGLLQGGFRVTLGIPSFIITLAGFSWLRGLAYVLSGAETLSGAGDTFYDIANGEFPVTTSLVIILVLAAIHLYGWVRAYTGLLGPQRYDLRAVNLVILALSLCAAGLSIWVFATRSGIPYPLAFLALVVFVMEYASRHTRFGRYVYAIGGNPTSAKRAGIKVDRTILALFGLMGALTAVAATIQTSRLDAGPPNVGLFVNLSALSAAIIGGTSLFGGEGRVLGTVIGALLMASITNGLSLAGVDTFYQMIITGGLLIVAVSADHAAQRRPR